MKGRSLLSGAPSAPALAAYSVGGAGIPIEQPSLNLRPVAAEIADGASNTLMGPGSNFRVELTDILISRMHADSVVVRYFGSGDALVAGDFNGDGRDDLDADRADVSSFLIWQRTALPGTPSPMPDGNASWYFILPSGDLYASQFAMGDGSVRHAALMACEEVFRVPDEPTSPARSGNSNAYGDEPLGSDLIELLAKARANAGVEPGSSSANNFVYRPTGILGGLLVP